MNGLNGARVGILEGRMSGELASLIERQGGTAVSAPAVHEEERSSPDAVERVIGALSGEPGSLVVLSTGVGVQALFHQAEALGRKEELKQALAASSLVARGPKPSAALAKEGLTPSVRVAEPYTTQEILQALEKTPLDGKRAVVLHYGERNAALVDALAQRKARVDELLLYEWKLPEDRKPVEALIDELVRGALDAVAFTSQVQIRHLFQIAAAAGKEKALADALKTRTVVAAVGPTCARALRERQIEPQVVPEHPKMGQMVLALARHMAQRG